MPERFSRWMVPQLFSAANGRSVWKACVDVPYDSGFLVLIASDGIDFFLLTKLPAEFFVFTAEMFVLKAVAEETESCSSQQQHLQKDKGYKDTRRE